VSGKSQQTFTSFSDKWEHNPKLAFAETLDESSEIFQWILTRNGFQSPADFEAWLSRRTRVLDAGCGNGRITALLRKYAPPSAEILGIDLAPAVAKDNLAGFDRTRVEAGDLMGDLTGFGTFDLIYCQEVLHHTADPRAAFLNLSGRLTDGGEIAIYVYKRKAPLREYADDYVRSRVSELPYDEAMKAMHGLTELGRALSEVDARVRVPDVPVIGIEAGEYDVQRLLYHFFLKCFWNRSLSFADNAAVNYDWYHPQLSTRHTLTEVEEWISAAGLATVHSCVDHYGITIRAVKPRPAADGA